MERIHAPLLMNPLVQAIVVALFVTGNMSDDLVGSVDVMLSVWKDEVCCQQ